VRHGRPFPSRGATVAGAGPDVQPALARPSLEGGDQRLGLYLIIGGIAWTIFIYNGVAVPD
jgi:hypothetical protein